MSVRRMLREMGSDELSEWMAYYNIEPFGGPRADLQAGTIAAAIVNSAPFRSDRAKIAMPSDFPLPFDGEPRKSRQQTTADQRLGLQRFAASIRARKRGQHRQPGGPGDGER